MLCSNATRPRDPSTCAKRMMLHITCYNVSARAINKTRATIASHTIRNLNVTFFPLY